MTVNTGQCAICGSIHHATDEHVASFATPHSSISFAYNHHPVSPLRQSNPRPQWSSRTEIDAAARRRLGLISSPHQALDAEGYITSGFYIDKHSV